MTLSDQLLNRATAYPVSHIVVLLQRLGCISRGQGLVFEVFPGPLGDDFERERTTCRSAESPDDSYSGVGSAYFWPRLLRSRWRSLLPLELPAAILDDALDTIGGKVAGREKADPRPVRPLLRGHNCHEATTDSVGKIALQGVACALNSLAPSRVFSAGACVSRC